MIRRFPALHAAAFATLLSFSCATVPLSQKQALLDLFHAAGGPDWRWPNQPWDFTTDPCDDSWAFTYCDGTSTNIIALLMENIGMTGSVPPSLVDLIALSELDISYNYIASPLPANFFTFGNLTRLTLKQSGFTGQLPTIRSFGVPNLATLDLSYNSFSGTIPPTLDTLSNLQFLDLSYNQFSGSFPDGFSNFFYLTYIAASGNALNGTLPATLGNLEILTVIDFRANSLLTGSIPPGYCKIQQLKALLLDTNQLTGTIPECIGSLSNLQWFDISTNAVEGTIPDSMGNLLFLQDFQAHDNQLTGTIPSSLGKLLSLEWLYLYNNELTGTVPEELGNLAHLQSLCINNNGLTGPFPSGIFGIQSLTWLDIGSNMLSGTIPGYNPYLMYFNASQNMFTGTPPVYTPEPYTTALTLDLTSNCLSGPVSSGFLTNVANCSFHSVFLDFNELTNDTDLASACVRSSLDCHGECSVTHQRPLPGYSCIGCSCCILGANGQLCSGHGTCQAFTRWQQSEPCICEAGYSGEACQFTSTE